MKNDISEKHAALKKKSDQLNARLQQLEAQMLAERKKSDTRRKILVGAYIIDLLEKEQKIEFSSWAAMKRALDKFLTREGDRKLFDLPKMVEPEAVAEAEPA